MISRSVIPRVLLAGSAATALCLGWYLWVLLGRTEFLARSIAKSPFALSAGAQGAPKSKGGPGRRGVVRLRARLRGRYAHHERVRLISNHGSSTGGRWTTARTSRPMTTSAESSYYA